MDTTFYSLATKSNFNKALRHFFKVNEVVDEVESNKNLADVINDLIEEDEVLPDQVLPIVGAVIRDKYQYSYDSYTIPQNVEDFSKISGETAKWTAMDIIMIYYSPRDEVIVINPKNMIDAGRVREFAQDQLLVIYAKYLKEDNKKIEEEAINAVEEMIAGKDVFINKEFIDPTKTERPAAKPAAKTGEPAAAGAGPAAQPAKKAPPKKRNATPLLDVMVSNELFHNGNVEAWKKIIESYRTSFPDLDVYVYFDGEIVNDLNSLFKWGKVKHADSIFFQVAGDNIRGVSKLKKYLYEGASPRFEQFLKAGVGKVLNLF